MASKPTDVSEIGRGDEIEIGFKEKKRKAVPEAGISGIVTERTKQRVYFENEEGEYIVSLIGGKYAMDTYQKRDGEYEYLAFVENVRTDSDPDMEWVAEKVSSMIPVTEVYTVKDDGFLLEWDGSILPVVATEFLDKNGYRVEYVTSHTISVVEA